MENLIRVFVSRPTLVSPADAHTCEALESVLRTLGFKWVTVGVNNFGNEVPLRQVRSVMSSCHGAVVLGLRQMTVRSAISKPGTREQTRMRNFGLPSPWNQIESAMAYAMDLPMLLVKGNVQANGIFDAAAGDAFVHQVPADGDWTGSPQLSAAFHDWSSRVRARAAS
jgi:hypothetical protein